MREVTAQGVRYSRRSGPVRDFAWLLWDVPCMVLVLGWLGLCALGRKIAGRP